MSMPASRSPRWPTSRTPCLHGASTPADELLGDYREAESASGVGWNYLAAINLIETRFGSIAASAPPARRARCSSCPRRSPPTARRRHPLAPRQHHGGRPLPRRQRLCQRSRSRHLPLQQRQRIRAGGQRLRSSAGGRSRNVRRLLPLGRLLLTPPVTCCSPSVTPRRHRSRRRLSGDPPAISRPGAPNTLDSWSFEANRRRPIRVHPS